jgi:gliding motility-associated-like protein
MNINVSILNRVILEITQNSSAISRMVMSLLFISLMLPFTGTTTAQTLPPLVHQLNLNNGSPYDQITGQQGTVSGALTGAFDRFGRQDGATFFPSSPDGTGIKLNKNSQYPNAYVKRTVSVWVYIGYPSYIPIGPRPFPSGSTQEEIFNLLDQNRGIRYNGLSRTAATIGLNRYIKNTSNRYSNWYLWHYLPVQFDQKGWYHIITTASAYFTRTYMYKPDGNMACTMTYMGTQTIDNSFVVTLGAFGISGGSPISYMDDLKIYGDTVSKIQVQQIHANDLVSPSGSFLPVTGKIYRIKNVRSGLYMSLQDPNNSNNNKAIQQYENYAGSAYLWQFVPLSSGRVLIKNVYSRKTLALTDVNTSNGTPISIWNTHSSDSEWLLDSYSNGRFRLQNGFSNKYAVVQQSSTSGGAKIIQWDDGQDNALWVFEEVSIPNIDENKTYFIESRFSGLTVTLNNFGLTNGTGINQNSDNYAGATQLWKLKKNEYGQYALISKLTNKELQVNEASSADAALITQWDQGEYAQGNWQIFEPSISNASDRFFYIANGNSSKLMVIQNGSASGSTIFQYGGENQNGRWKFKESNNAPITAKDKVYRIVNRHSGKYLCLNNYDNDNNTETNQMGDEASTGARHLFKILKDGEERYDIVNFYTGKSLQLDNSASNLSADGVQLRQKLQQQNAYQKWILSGLDSSPGYFHISNALTGKPIVVQEASTNDGERVFQYSAGAGQNGDWRFEEVDITPKSNGQTITRARFNNRNSGKYLDLLPRNNSNGALAVQSSEYGTYSWDEWLLNRLADGKYQLVNFMTNKPIAVENNSIHNNARVMQWEADQIGTNGAWIIFKSGAPGENYWRLANLKSGLYAVVESASTSEDAHIIQYWGGSENSQWSIYPSRTSTVNRSVSARRPAPIVPDHSNTYPLKASTVLSPNGDGINDLFIVKNIDHYPKNTLKIYDKSGKILYNKKTYANDWDGKVNGRPLQAGTYNYSIERGNGYGSFKGAIKIVRN